MTPQLAICVPTHSGRARGMDELLRRLAGEPGIEGVEICISDNASTDGTADVVARHRPGFGELLRYVRNERNLGMAENVLRAIELSNADYCWLMGSDDAPAPGSLSRVCALLDEHAGVSGLALGLKRVHANDLEQPAHLVVPEPFPPQRTVTRLRSRLEIAQSIGYVTYFTSCNVIHRGRWQAVVDSERDAALAAGSGPHLYVTGRMATSDPDWVWCPELLVLSREAELYLADAGELGKQPIAIARRIVADLDRIWARLYGRYSYAHRALMFKALRHNWSRESILYRRRTAPVRSQFLAALSCARRFWWSRQFWRQFFPALIVPVAPLRYTGSGRRPLAMRPLAESDRRVTLDGALPDAMTAGYTCWVTVRVENCGDAAVSSAGPNPVTIASRWRDAARGEDSKVAGMHTTIWPPLRPGSSRSLEVLINPPWQTGTHVLTVAPVQAGVAWFDAAGSGRGVEATVRVGPPPS